MVAADLLTDPGFRSLMGNVILFVAGMWTGGTVVGLAWWMYDRGRRDEKVHSAGTQHDAP